MKRVLSVLLLFTIALFGANSFWQELIEIEKKFFSDEIIITLISDTNTSKIFDENQTTARLEERVHAYEGLLLKLKNEPYSLDKANNPYFNPKESEKKINTLMLKIDANRKYGYLQAVKRDKLKVQSLKLKQQIYTFFHYLADNWTTLEEKNLIEYIQKQKELLEKSIAIKDIIAVYEEVSSQKGTVAQQIKKNFFDLARDYYFFESFLDYLTINAKLLTYHSIAAELQLDNLINYINKQPLAAKINIYLRYLKLDIGRVILFTFVILFFWILNYLIYKRLYNYFKTRILQEEDETDDILIDNLDSIRKPVSLLINGIGLKLALEVLRYPMPLSEKAEQFFYIFYIIMIAYILMQLVENIFFLYFHSKQGEKNKQLRSELLNLILSVTKVIIFVAAFLVALVKMGVNVTGLIASLGIGGLAVALAAQDTLSNFFGLLKIIFDESFSQGDWIQTSDVEGTVVEIGFISTKIRTFDNALITVPNSKLANTPLKNWNRRTYGRRIKMHIGVTYSAQKENIEAAIEEIKEMLQNHPDIITHQKIDYRSIRRRHKEAGKFVELEAKLGIKTTLLVYLDTFSASSIDILIYTFTKSVNWEEWLAVKQDIMFKIMEILEQHNLEFAFPSQTLYFDKENIAQSAEALKRLK
jgi:MscS family membrane protein